MRAAARPSAVRKLLDLAPRKARRLERGVETEVPLADVRVGDLLRVKPGDAIPVDGVVRAGPLGGRRVDGHGRVAAGREGRRATA